MSERGDDIGRGAAELRFQRRRAELAESLGALLGAGAPEPLEDAGRAAALADEARAAAHDAESSGWALVRREWRRDDRAAVAALLQAIGERVGPRAAWLIVDDREPQAVPIAADAALDNPLGFASLGSHALVQQLMLVDEAVPGGLTLSRHAHHGAGGVVTFSWELEAWGAEPWLSAATRSIREAGARGDGD